MSEIVEELPLADGGRLLIYDDGSQQVVRGATIIRSEGPMSRDRGLEARELATSLRSTPQRHPVNPGNPEDMQWLRDQITSGNITRESNPILSVPGDEYLIVIDHAGWGYLLGRRNQFTYAQRVVGRLSSSLVYGSDKYPWGVRGSEAARAAWRRDFARAHPVASMLNSAETETALADTGIPPETVEPFRGIREFSLSDLPRAILMVSRAALEADEQIASNFQQFVAQYNGQGFPGSIVAVVAGILEFVVRFVVGIAALPAAIEMLCNEARNIMLAIQEALPDILLALQEAPVETIQELLQIALSAIAELTGLRDIRDQLATGVEVAGEGREAESSLRFTRAITRILELIIIVRGLISALRRLPAIARGLPTQLQRLNRLLPRLRAARRAIREGPSLPGTLGDTAEGGSHTGSRRRSPDPELESLEISEGLEPPLRGVDETPSPRRQARSPDSETERSTHSEASEPDDQSRSSSEADSTPPTFPPAFHDIHQVMQRLLIAADDGGEIVEADLRIARALRELMQQQRRSGSIPDALTRSFLELERQIDVIEAVSHRRQVAASGAQIFAEGGTPTNLMIGEAGEEIARRTLLARGYRNVMAAINRSNNGIDLIGIDRMGSVRVFEIKASRGGRAPTLSGAQRNAKSFALSRLQQIANRRGIYATASDATIATVRTLLRQLEQQAYVGGAVFEITHVFDISRIRVRIKPWRGTVSPRSSSWWARMFRRMGLPTH